MKASELFKKEGKTLSCTPYGCGHINDTYLLECEGGNKYLLQRINNKVFPNVEGLMNNIVSVTTYLRERIAENGGNPDRQTLTPIPLKTGGWYEEEDGGFWRMFIFIDDALTLQSPEEPNDFYNAGCAFGNFQSLLADFPADTLCEVIEGFHNTAKRFEQLEEAIKNDAAGRVKEVAEENRVCKGPQGRLLGSR